MKILILLLTFILSLNAFSQYTPNTRYGDKQQRISIDSTLLIPTGCGAPTSLKSVDLKKAAIYEDSCNNTMYYYDPKLTTWQPFGNGSGGLEIIPGGPITSLPAIGQNPGTSISSKQFIVSQFYASQPPTAELTGGGIYEYTTAGNVNRNLTWLAGRQSATAPIATIIVDGVAQSFTQPVLGGTVSGIKIAVVPKNTNTTYTNTVTTTDGKTATATTNFVYQNKIYAGFVSSATPSDAEIIAATGSYYEGGIFSDTRNQSGNLTTPSSSKYVVFASPASYGTPTVVINGLTVEYNKTIRNFTNASGGITPYIIAVSPFPTFGAIDVYLIN